MVKLALAAQDKYVVKAPNGLAFSEFHTSMKLKRMPVFLAMSIGLRPRVTMSAMRLCAIQGK